jgi:VIT1/CCC1 family predicted Fe2+/Mn2+ transporter
MTPFLSKFVFALTFIMPILLFEFLTAIVVSVIWGLSLLSIFSLYIARERRVKPWKVIMEHLLVALVVIVITHYVGDWISTICS